MNLGGLNKDQEMIDARSKCARCGHIFEDNEFKVSTDMNEFICEECEYKIDDFIHLHKEK